ncbi:MAG: hypothetical protein ACK559_03885, partial [bacterium]
GPQCAILDKHDGGVAAGVQARERGGEVVVAHAGDERQRGAGLVEAERVLAAPQAHRAEGTAVQAREQAADATAGADHGHRARPGSRGQPPISHGPPVRRAGATPRCRPRGWWP